MPTRHAQRRAALEMDIVNIEKNGAGDEIRTHDPHVGNVMLYP